MESSETLHQAFLDDIVDISPLIEDYMAANLFELEVEYSDGIDTSVLFNLVLGMVIGELTTMGIEIMGGTEIYEDPKKIELIKVLRREFDIRNLQRTLMANESLRSAIQSAASDWDEENIVNTVALLAKNSNPLGTTWDFIAKHSLKDVVSTHNLERHILRIIENIENGVFSNTYEDENIVNYTIAVAEQRLRFIRYVSLLRSNLIKIPNIMLERANMVIDEAILTYDIDLINNIDSESVAAYLDPQDPHPAYRADGSPDIQLVEHHKRLHYHHTECLVAKHIIQGVINEDAPYAMLLVADGYRESWSFEKNIEVLRSYIKDLKLSDECISLMEQWMKVLTIQ
jgi:hypothetical protein